MRDEPQENVAELAKISVLENGSLLKLKYRQIHTIHSLADSLPPTHSLLALRYLHVRHNPLLSMLRGNTVRWISALVIIVNNIRLHETPEYRVHLFLNWPKKGIQLIFRNFPLLSPWSHGHTSIKPCII